MHRLLCALALVVAQGGDATARSRYDVHVTVDPATATATGEVAIDVENEAEVPLASLELWLYPSRLAHLSPELTEINFYWLYPYRFDAGAITVDQIAVDGASASFTLRDHPRAGPRTLLVIPLAQPLAPHARARVTAHFATRVPRRYGSFGCYAGTCTLAAGFYPMLVAMDARGFDESAPPAVADYAIDARAASGNEVVTAGALGGRASLEAAIDPLVQVGPVGKLELRERVVRGVTVRYLHRDGPPTPSTPPGHALPYVVEDRPAKVLLAIHEAIDLLAEVGLAPPPGTVIPLVEAPLRMELAVPTSTAVLVSDEIYRLVPVERFRKFHSFQLVRAVFAYLLERRLAARERPGDLGWSPDVAGSWLVDRYTLREFRKEEFARDVLKWVSFIPTIDRILYAPQVPFAAAYFNTLDEPDPTRDDLRRFANQRPRGKTVYEKLRDLLGDDASERMMRALWSGVPLREAVRALGDQPLDWFWDQWLRPYPEVDYRFEVLGSTRVGDRWQHRIRLWRRGPIVDGNGQRSLGPTAFPREPVELRVLERGGTVHDLRWDGVGTEHVFTVETARPIARIELDPRGRLLERIASVNDDLRLDDRQPARIKFIYNNIGGLLNFQQLTLDLSLDFTLQRIYDVKNTTRFLLYRSTSAQVGLLASYTRGFGPKVTPARLEGAWSSSVRVSRLQPSFGRAFGQETPGTQLAVGTGVGSDDRAYIWEPWRATAMSISAAWVLTVLDPTAHAGTRSLQQFTVAADYERIVPVAPGHGFAFDVSAAATFGDLAIPSQMLAAGAPSYLRGYEVDELLGRLRLFGRIEYRHVFVHDLDVNLIYALYLRGISGGVFAEAGAISPCSGYAIGGNDVFGDVGYSLRFLADWLGVSQTTFNIDIAYPLVRRERSCFAEAGFAPVPLASRSPLGVFVYFGPVW